MITSPNNEQLKTIRKLQDRRWRERLGLFSAEGEDLVDAAAAAGWEPALLLRAGKDVEPELLRAVSTLGSPACAQVFGHRSLLHPMLRRSRRSEISGG